MSDIVAEIRSHLTTMAPHQRTRLTARQLTQAADEIERLRLTEEEREAIAYFAVIDGPQYLPQATDAAATLRGLLERTK